MERTEALMVATTRMGMEVAKAKKMSTNQLVKKVETWMAENPVVEAKKTKTRVTVKHGRFMLGWTTPTGNVRVLKYCTIRRNGNACQTVVDAELNPEKMSRVHVYGKESTALKQRDMMVKANPEMYAGLEVISK